MNEDTDLSSQRVAGNNPIARLFSRRNTQVASLYGSMVMGLLVGIAVSVINTRLLGPEQFGNYKFLQTIFTFCVSFITFGFFVSGSRLLAQKKHDSVRTEIVGALFVIAVILSALFSVVIFAFSFFEERIFDNELGPVIRLFAPLLFIYPFRLCLENVFQGDNRIYELSIFRLAPQALYILIALIFNVVVPLDLMSALAIQFISSGLIIIGMAVLLKPRFGDVRANLALIMSENRSYGLHVYLGALAGVATGQLGGVAIAYFVDNTNVGYFSLALTLTLPLAMIPNVIGTTLFKEFANSERIPTAALAATTILSAVALIVFLLIVEPVVILLYSEAFRSVVPLANVLAVASIVHGMGDFFNRFLSAHGRGVALRNGAIVVGLVNVAGYILLVDYFGVDGATSTRLVSGAVYFLLMSYIYVRYLGQRARA